MYRYKVYLSGPIASLTPAEATSWRAYAQKFLLEYSKGEVIGICPMRHSSFKKEHGHRREDDVLKDAHACYLRDKNDIKECNLMFVNVIDPPQRISMGTNIEIGWADAFGKPIICVANRDGMYDKDLLFRATIDNMYYDLDIGLRNCCDFLLP